MNTFRIALANIRFPQSPEDSVELALQTIGQASHEGARVICFPECFVPGYRGAGKQVPPPDQQFLERAWSNIAAAAGEKSFCASLCNSITSRGSLRSPRVRVDALRPRRSCSPRRFPMQARVY